jgi:hypothetical protein
LINFKYNCLILVFMDFTFAELRGKEQGDGGELDVGRWQRRDKCGPID